MRHRAAAAICAALVATFLAMAPMRTDAAELLMLERAGCAWCAEWDRVIGPIYPKSDEGKRAPLRRVDVERPLPDDLAGISKGRYTPTFILMEDGEEIGRITGYPGEDFFWGLLSELVAKLPSDGTKGS